MSTSVSLYSTPDPVRQCCSGLYASSQPHHGGQCRHTEDCVLRRALLRRPRPPPLPMRRAEASQLQLLEAGKMGGVLPSSSWEVEDRRSARTPLSENSTMRLAGAFLPVLPLHGQNSLVECRDPTSSHHSADCLSLPGSNITCKSQCRGVGRGWPQRCCKHLQQLFSPNEHSHFKHLCMII
jgi:hypothetical protein